MFNKLLSITFILFISSVFFISTVVVAFAQDEVAPTGAAEEKGEVVKLKRGTLASSTSSFGVKAVDQVTDGTVSGDPTSAIGGSVKQLSNGKCLATIYNSDAESGYSVNFEVLSKSSTGGGFPKRRSFTGTVPAGGNLERSFSCGPTDNFQVNLTGGRRLKLKKKQ